MKNFKYIVISVFLTLLGAHNVVAGGGAGTAGGLSFLEPPGARPAAMGEAFTAVTNDLSAFGYNPASLQSLQSGQAAFMYQKGMADDAYGHFMIGGPMKSGSLGLAVGYYNAGSMDLTDENLNTRTVNAQTDLTVSLGYARKIGNTSAGLTVKYLSSKLIEQYEAKAYAADLGIQSELTSRLGIGVAIQNLGNKVTYLSEGDSLPRIYRAGMSYMLIPGAHMTTLLLDAPYHANEKQLRPAAGLEVKLGPLAVRGGYKKTAGLQNEFTVGAGFLMGGSAIDYSFGMVDQLSAEHRVSVSMRFGESSYATSPIVKKPSTGKMASKPRAVEEMKPVAAKPAVTFMQRKSLASTERGGGSFAAPSRQVYIVRPGDTLGKIAQRFYGDAKEWKKIYAANRHLLENNQSIEVGQKIVLP